MIKNNRFRMLCRSISSSKMIAYAWLFIVLCMSIIFLKNKKINNIFIIMFIIVFFSLVICTKLDYKERLKNNNVWKLIHYILTVILLLIYLCCIVSIKSKYLFHIVFLTIIFFYSMVDKNINGNICIILELIIVYTCNFLLLHDTYSSIK